MESEGYSTDEGKKRKGGEMEESFQRSKKTLRSPPKDHDNDKLEQILKLIKEMSVEQREMRQEQKETKKDIQEMKNQQEEVNLKLMQLITENEYLKKENDNIRMENEEIRKENEKIRNELTELGKTVEKMERERKTKNIVISGWKTDTHEPQNLKERVEHFLNQNLQVNIQAKAITILGKSTCMLELESEKDKNLIMINKYKLKHGKERIFINDDLTNRERKKQYELRAFAKTEKEKGKQVKMGYNKVIVNGEEWRWNNQSGKIMKNFSKN